MSDAIVSFKNIEKEAKAVDWLIKNVGEDKYDGPHCWSGDGWYINDWWHEGIWSSRVTIDDDQMMILFLLSSPWLK